MESDAEYLQEVAAERSKRLQLLRAMRGKLAQALAAFDPETATLSEIVGGVRMVSDQLRLEFKAPPPASIEEIELASAVPPADVEPAPPADPLEGLKVYRPTG